MVPGVPHKSDSIVILTSNTLSVEELRKALEQGGYRIRIAKHFEIQQVGWDSNRCLTQSLRSFKYEQITL